MKTWIIEPRDAFIARDGRPFSTGGRAKSLPFPFPSTTTGGTRTRTGLDTDGIFVAAIADVKKIEVRGPLLVQLDDVTGAIAEWFAPAPSDALLFEIEGKDKQAMLRQLLPRELPTGATTDFLCDNNLQPVYLSVNEKSKPFGNAPRYWYWCEFEKWLLTPDTLANREHQLSCLGNYGPVFDSRTHVKVLHDSQTSEEGNLFQTSGLEFTHRVDEETCAADRLALVIQTNATESLDGLSHLGGERRFVCWREGKAMCDVFNSNCPEAIQEAIIKSKCCRIVLLTPAHFINGVMPTWLCDDTLYGFKAELKAIANSRYQVVSGWDFEKNASNPFGRPKPTRRLVPAGAVFWFDLLKGTDEQIKEWIEKIWMRCVSDEDQDRKDGFGLAVLGTWSK